MTSFENRAILAGWRQRIGEAGCEWLLAHTIEAAKSAGVMKRRGPGHGRCGVVDITLQPKAIAHPTDSRLLNRAREQLVQAAQEDVPCAAAAAHEARDQEASHLAGPSDPRRAAQGRRCW